MWLGGQSLASARYIFSFLPHIPLLFILSILSLCLNIISVQTITQPPHNHTTIIPSHSHHTITHQSHNHTVTMSVAQDMEVVLPREQHTHTIIFLCGEDIDAKEFASSIIESQAYDAQTLPEIFPTLKWVFPTSKMRMSQRSEDAMSKWSDGWSSEDSEEEEQEDESEELDESVSFVLELIHQEMEFVEPSKIFLAASAGGAPPGFTEISSEASNSLGLTDALAGWIWGEAPLNEGGAPRRSDRCSR